VLSGVRLRFTKADLKVRSGASGQGYVFVFYLDVDLVPQKSRNSWIDFMSARLETRVDLILSTADIDFALMRTSAEELESRPSLEAFLGSWRRGAAKPAGFRSDQWVA